MADSCKEHPYGTCEGCGADIWEFGGRAGDTHCRSCRRAIREEQDEQHRKTTSGTTHHNLIRRNR